MKKTIKLFAILLFATAIVVGGCSKGTNSPDNSSGGSNPGGGSGGGDTNTVPQGPDTLSYKPYGDMKYSVPVGVDTIVGMWKLITPVSKKSIELGLIEYYPGSLENSTASYKDKYILLCDDKMVVVEKISIDSEAINPYESFVSIDLNSNTTYYLIFRGKTVDKGKIQLYSGVGYDLNDKKILSPSSYGAIVTVK